MAENENAEPNVGRSASFLGRTVRSRRLMGALAAVAVVCGVGAMMVYAYNKGRQHGAAGEPPVIRAQEGPIKVRPEEPGGMAVPDRDKEVFTRLETGERPANVERLLPPPDNPVERPFAAPETAPETRETAPETPEAAPETRETAAETPEAGRPAADSSSGIRRMRIRSGYEIVLRKKPPPPAAGAFAVQIASLRSEAAVRARWSDLKRGHPDLLRGLSLSVERVALENGAQYRLRAGPLPDRAAAGRLCDRLNEREIGCLIVRRRP